NSIWFTAGTILQVGSFKSFSRFLIPKLETPMFLTLPVAGSFWSSCLVEGQSPFLYGIKEDLPCLNEVPVGQMLLGVIRVGGAGPVHQVEVDIVQAKALKGRINALR